jgi:hypothetical protein
VDDITEASNESSSTRKKIFIRWRSHRCGTKLVNDATKKPFPDGIKKRVKR